MSIRLLIGGNFRDAIYTGVNAENWIRTGPQSFIDHDGEKVVVVSKPESLKGYKRGSRVYLTSLVKDRPDIGDLEEILRAKQTELVYIGD